MEFQGKTEKEKKCRIKRETEFLRKRGGKNAPPAEGSVVPPGKKTKGPDARHKGLRGSWTLLGPGDQKPNFRWGEISRDCSQGRMKSQEGEIAEDTSRGTQKAPKR